MKYTVYVTELSYGRIEVEAASAKEAEEKANEEYHKGNILWHDSEENYTAEPMYERKRDEAR